MIGPPPIAARALAALLVLGAVPRARAIFGVADTSFVTVIANPAEALDWASELERLGEQLETARNTLQTVSDLRAFAGNPMAAVAALGNLQEITGAIDTLAAGGRTAADLERAWQGLGAAQRLAAATALLQASGAGTSMPVFGQAQARDTSAYAGFAQDAAAADQIRGQIAGEQSARASVASALAGAWEQFRAATSESQKQALLSEISQLQAQDHVMDARRRAMLDDLDLSDREARGAAGVRAQAADEQLLAESALLNADARTRAQGAEAQRLATLQRLPAAPAPADYSGIRLWTTADTGGAVPVNPAPASDLLDVFTTYDGSVVFRGLTEGADGQPPLLGTIGWIFTGFGALFVLWGFVLRTQRSAGENKMGEIAKTWIVIALMVGGPFIMRAAMEGADSVYASSPGGPRNLTTACVKAAYAMPELNQLFDVLRRSALAPGPASPAPGAPPHGALVASATDGSILGYLEAFGVSVWDTATGYATTAAQGWNGLVRMVALAAGMGSAMLKCLLIALTIIPLYLLFLSAAAIVWFMEQLRYFLAVSGTAMLPLFIGLFSLPEGHANRQAAQGYVMHMLSLALWPVAWAIGHTGTISLYNALISLVAGTSRVPDMVGVLQWSSLTTAAPSEAQLQATEAALGNWFMGNLTGLLSILVGGLGFVIWVLIVSILGPAFLHKLLATGALFMAQAAGTAGRQSAVAGKLAVNLAQSIGTGGFPGVLASGGGAGERLAGAMAARATPFDGGFAFRPQGDGPASMRGAARSVDDSGGKNAARM